MSPTIMLGVSRPNSKAQLMPYCDKTCLQVKSQSLWTDCHVFIRPQNLHQNNQANTLNFEYESLVIKRSGIITRLLSDKHATITGEMKMIISTLIGSKSACCIESTVTNICWGPRCPTAIGFLSAVTVIVYHNQSDSVG